jgi:transposase
MRQPYHDSDRIDEEWQQLEPLLPPEKSVGIPALLEVI